MPVYYVRIGQEIVFFDLLKQILKFMHRFTKPGTCLSSIIGLIQHAGFLHHHGGFTLVMKQQLKDEVLWQKQALE